MNEMSEEKFKARLIKLGFVGDVNKLEDVYYDIYNYAFESGYDAGYRDSYEDIYYDLYNYAFEIGYDTGYRDSYYDCRDYGVD